jgi:hypothetical protein
MLTRDAKTVLKGGIGLFYDRVPLSIASFAFLPDRTVSTLSSAGSTWASQTYVDSIARGLRNPRGVGWNIEMDRQISSALVVKAGFQERNTARDFALDPQAAVGRLSLSNSGRSFYREFQLTGRYKVRRGTINASYVRSKAFGNLNDFNQFFGNSAVPVINPDESGRLPFDAPNRFLAWGQWDAPFKLTVLPVLDVHTGFPYSQTDQLVGFRTGHCSRLCIAALVGNQCELSSGSGNSGDRGSCRAVSYRPAEIAPDASCSPVETALPGLAQESRTRRNRNQTIRRSESSRYPSYVRPGPGVSGIASAGGCCCFLVFEFAQPRGSSAGNRDRYTRSKDLRELDARSNGSGRKWGGRCICAVGTSCRFGFGVRFSPTHPGYAQLPRGTDLARMAHPIQ